MWKPGTLLPEERLANNAHYLYLKNEITNKDCSCIQGQKHPDTQAVQLWLVICF